MSKKLSAKTDNTQPSLQNSVEKCLTHYLKQLDGDEPAELYRLVINETECALFKIVLEHTNNNQTKAAECLGITRGTLRKKIKQYRLFEN